MSQENPQPQQTNKIQDLTPEQEQRWNELCQDYGKWAIATRFVHNRSSVEQVLLALYKDLKRDPPQIIWCQSLGQMVLMPAIMEQLVKDKLRKRTLLWCRANLRGPFWTHLWQDLETQLPILRKIEGGLRDRQVNPMWSRIGPIIAGSVKERLLGIVVDSHPQMKAMLDISLLRRLKLQNEEQNTAPFATGLRIPLRQALDDLCGHANKDLRGAVSSLIRTQVCELPERKLLPKFSWSAGLCNREPNFDGQLDSEQCAQFTAWTDGRLAGQLFETMRHYWTSSSLGWLRWLVFFNEFVLPVRLAPEIEREIERWTFISRQVFGMVFFENVVFVSERPTLLRLDERIRIHCDDGPAVEFSDGFRIHSWHGTLVSEYIIERPEEITVEKINSEINTEVRRVMIERFGQGRYLSESDSLKIHHDEFGELYRKQVEDDEPLVMVKLRNSTAEPDGTYKYYFLRVPPDTSTAREAVAWTFGMNAVTYGPAEET
jgi:hypothetical protein